MKPAKLPNHISNKYFTSPCSWNANNISTVVIEIETY